MKKTLFIGTVLLALIACTQTKKEEQKTGTSTVEAVSDAGLYKNVEKLVWAEIKDPKSGRSKEDIVQFEREETDSMIIIGKMMDCTFYISKLESIKADFDENGSEDALIPVDMEFGVSGGTTLYYLFLYKGGKMNFIETYDATDLASSNITDKEKLSRGKFIYENVSGNLLVGSGTYYGQEDANCCPTYSIEKLKFKFNPKTNEFEQVFQSELNHNETNI